MIILFGYGKILVLYYRNHNFSHREITRRKESNCLFSTLLLESYMAVDFKGQLMSASIIIHNQYSYHDKTQSYSKSRPINFTYAMKMMPLKHDYLIY